MSDRKGTAVRFVAACAALCAAASSRADAPLALRWETVVNNGDLIPGFTKTFNSYNQPSVNARGLVVFRARGKGPGEPPHGIFTRDMEAGGAIVKVADRSSLVPPPNNLGTTFVEFPSFPRIDRDTDALAFRGNSEPVYLPGEGLERVGTTGVFATPGGVLVTGASKLGAIPGYERYAVPGSAPPIAFDVFPGAPSMTDGATIVFKGNYTEAGIARTGAYYRDLWPSLGGGASPVQLLADNAVTAIPGSSPARVFGSVGPPSAAGGTAVFSGFDDENAPTIGGIYLAPLAPEPALRVLARIGGAVPDERGRGTADVFTRLGEGVSYDGRFVGFWGAWGAATRPVVVHCPAEGNMLRRNFCLAQCPEPGGCTFRVPVHQGFFVHDTANGHARRVAATGGKFLDFLFWNFSGKVPGQTGEDDGELARWRSAAFIAVDGHDSGNFQAAFKGEALGGIDGIYLCSGAGPASAAPMVVLDTSMDGSAVEADPRAAGLAVTEVGIERDALRGGHLAITARMGSEESGWAGIYLAHVSRSPGRGR